jgi:hypothetical protein
VACYRKARLSWGESRPAGQYATERHTHKVPAPSKPAVKLRFLSLKLRFLSRRLTFLGRGNPFDTGSVPLSYGGNPGVRRRISQGGVLLAAHLWLSITLRHTGGGGWLLLLLWRAERTVCALRVCALL